MNNRMKQEILHDLRTTTLKDNLTFYPGTIKTQKAIIRQLRTEYDEANQSRAMLEAEIMTDVASETGDQGKAKYSNDTTRRAELMKRQGGNMEYLAAARVAKSAEYAAAEAQDELEKLQDEFKSLRIVARMVSDEISLWASDGTDNEARDDTAELPWSPSYQSNQVQPF